MYADLNCTCFCTKQMLTADASVFGVYKCLCSLLNVLVLLLLEIDLKRVYLFHTGAFGPTRDECFQSSPGKHCCVLRYVFCCGTMSCQNEQFHWGVLPFRRRLNVKRKQRKSKRSVWINWDRNNFFFFFFAKLSYFICTDFDSPREAVLSGLHSMRWQLLSVRCMQRIRINTGIITIIDLRCMASSLWKRTVTWLVVFRVLFLVFWPKCYTILSPNTQRRFQRSRWRTRTRRQSSPSESASARRPFIPIFQFQRCAMCTFSCTQARTEQIFVHTYSFAFGLMHFYLEAHILILLSRRSFFFFVT